MKDAEFYRLVGEQIRRLRKSRGESQTQLAEALKEKANTISRWELGFYRPTAHDIDRIAQHFHASPLAFFPTRVGFEQLIGEVERGMR